MLICRPSVTDTTVFISLPVEDFPEYQAPWCKVFRPDQLRLAYFVLSALQNKDNKEQLGISGHVIFWLNDDHYESDGRVLHVTFLSENPVSYTLSHKEALLLAKTLVDVYSENEE